jgi:hypothetical protein
VGIVEDMIIRERLVALALVQVVENENVVLVAVDLLSRKSGDLPQAGH